MFLCFVCLGNGLQSSFTKTNSGFFVCIQKRKCSIFKKDELFEVVEVPEYILLLFCSTRMLASSVIFFIGWFKSYRFYTYHRSGEELSTLCVSPFSPHV